MLEDKKEFYIELIENYVNVLRQKQLEIETKKRDMEQYAYLFTDDGLDINAFLEMDNSKKSFIIYFISNSFNIPETIKSIEQYAIIKNGNNQLLLQSNQFKQKQELVNNINILIKEQENSIKNRENELLILNTRMNVLSELLSNKISNSLNLDAEELSQLIDVPLFNEKQKTELLAILAKIASKYFQNQIEERDRRIIEEIEENDNRLREQAAQVEDADIEKKVKEIIKNAIETDDNIKNQINLMPEQNDLLDELVIFMISNGEKIQDITVESAKKNILTYIKRSLKAERKKLLNIIFEDEDIKKLITDYLDKSFDVSELKKDVSEYLMNNDIQLTKESVEKRIKEIIINNEIEKVDKAYADLAIIKSIIDDNITAQITEKEDDYIDEELIEKSKHDILKSGFKPEEIEKQLEYIEQLKGIIKSNVHLLFDNSEYFNTEDFKNLAIVNECLKFVKEFNSFTIKETEFYESMEAELIVSLAKNLSETANKVGEFFANPEEAIKKDSPIEPEPTSSPTPTPVEPSDEKDEENNIIKEYYRKILFTKDFIEDIKNMSVGNKEGVNRVFNCINQLETVDSLSDVTFKYHGFTENKVGHKYALLVKKGVITNSGRSPVRFFFIPKTVVDSDGNKETYYVVFYADKKIKKNDKESANRIYAHNRLNNTLLETDYLLGLMDNEQDFDNARHDQLKYIKAMIKALG